MTAVSIIIPVGPGHRALAHRSIRSAERQTYPCNIVVIDDGEKRGAGWARNQGANLSKTDFLVFLDADDEIHPDFVLKSLQTFANSGRYVYTDWRRHKTNGTGLTHVEDVSTPDYSIANLYKYAFFHAVTTLLPRLFWRKVGGFDEQLPAWEDNDFYYKLASAGLCGVRLPEVLFTYHASDGQRRRIGFENRHQLWQTILERYPMTKGKCCGQATMLQKQQTETKAPFDWSTEEAVEVEFIRGGSLAFKGLATRIRYPRSSQGQHLWVHKDDAAAEKNRPGGAYFRPLEGSEREIVENIKKLQERVKNELG